MDDNLRTDHDKLQGSGTRSGFLAAVMLFGAAKGVPMARLQEATGLTLADLVDPDARVPDASLGAAWRVIAASCPDEALGLEMAAGAPMSVFGPLAQVARFAQTRRAALESFCRYQKLLSGGLTMALHDQEDTAALQLEHHLDASDGGHGAEAALALAVRIGRELLQHHDAVLRIEFAHAPNSALERYTAWFERPVHFETGRNAVVFMRDRLDAPAPQPDPTMYRYIDAHLELVHQRLLQQVAEAPLDEVRATIAELGHRSVYGAAPLAKAMGMSLRSLQRHARSHGASVRELVDTAREANARELLADERLSVDEIAFLVGYSDDRAFRRAFRRWTGLTPRAFRVQHA